MEGNAKEPEGHGMVSPPISPFNHHDLNRLKHCANSGPILMKRNVKLMNEIS